MRNGSSKKVLTTGEVARICNVAPRTVSKWFDSGQLRGYRIPGSKDRRIPLEQLVRFMKSHGIPTDGLSLGAPTVLLMLAEAPEARGVRFDPRVRVATGGSPPSPTLLARMDALGVDVTHLYGLTETTGAISALPSRDHDPGGPRGHLLRSAGRPWGDVGVRIVDPETGRDVPGGQVGEIWIQSVQNMRGYWKNPEATAAVFPEGRDANGIGWLRSGDAGYLQDGYIFMHDRVKDMILSGGENIYPAEVENVLMHHPAVADAAVIGVPSEQWGEAVKAVIVPRGGADFSEREIIDYCRERLAHYKCPSSVDRVAALPRNPSGKILKTELREPYWKGRSRRVN